MTKFFQLLTLMLLVATSTATFATTCPDATRITSFPVVNLPFTCGTTDDINDVTATSLCTTIGSYYLDGTEAVLKGTAPQDAYVTMTLTGLNTYSAVWLFSGCPTSGGTCVGAASNGSAGGNITLSASVYAGNTYFIVVDSWPAPPSPCSGTQAISISASAPLACPSGLPALAFNQAMNLSCDTTNLVNNATASVSCLTAGGFNTSYINGKEAMVTYTPTQTGAVMIEGSGLQTYSSIVVYDACPVTGGACVAAYASTASGTKSLVATLTQGVMYYIVVDVWPSPEISPCDLGTAAIIVKDVPPPPPGDVCATAQNLNTLPSHVVGSTLLSDGYNNDYSNTCGTSTTQTTSRDRFYYIDVPNGNTFSFEQTVNSFDSEIFFRYGGACPGDMEALCWDDADTDPQSWTNTTGATQRLYIIMDGYGSTASGTFEFDWALTGSCDAPTGLSTTAVNGTATGTWGAVAGAQGYQIRGKLSTGTNYSLIPANGLITGTTRVVNSTKIRTGRTYMWQVRAMCADGTWSDWSAEASITALRTAQSKAANIEMGEMTLSPNPTTGSFSLTLDEVVTNAQLSILSVNGAVVKQMNVSGDNITVSSDELPTGVYLVRVQTGDALFTQKLIKQ